MSEEHTPDRANGITPDSLGNTTQGEPSTNTERLLARCMAQLATEQDIAQVNEQLGRYPRGMVAVGARCVCGTPLAVVTRPMLPGNIPFPTTMYLTCPEAVKAVSHLEADGVMKEYNQQLQEDPELKQRYEQAHQAYLDFRHALAEELGDDETHIAGISAGGMPERVKCLHALVAQSLVMGPGVNPVGDMALERMKAEFDPKVCRCAVPETASGAVRESATETVKETAQSEE